MKKVKKFHSRFESEYWYTIKCVGVFSELWSKENTKKNKEKRFFFYLTNEGKRKNGNKTCNIKNDWKSLWFLFWDTFIEERKIKRTNNISANNHQPHWRAHIIASQEKSKKKKKLNWLWAKLFLLFKLSDANLGEFKAVFLR